MKIDRLISIIMILLERKKISATKLAEKFRTFKLSRISSLEVLDETFIPRKFDAKPLGAWDNLAKNIIEIKLLVHESLRDRISEYCGEESIQPYGEDKLIVNFPFEENDFGYNILLSFGDKCECLEPVRVKDEIKFYIFHLVRVLTLTPKSFSSSISTFPSTLSLLK